LGPWATAGMRKGLGPRKRKRRKGRAGYLTGNKRAEMGGYRRRMEVTAMAGRAMVVNISPDNKEGVTK